MSYENDWFTFPPQILVSPLRKMGGDKAQPKGKGKRGRRPKGPNLMDPNHAFQKRVRFESTMTHE